MRPMNPKVKPDRNLREFPQIFFHSSLFSLIFFHLIHFLPYSLISSTLPIVGLFSFLA